MSTQDFTKGNVYGHLVRLSVPLVIGNILQQFYNTIDALIVGRFSGMEEFAAIGIAGTVMNLFLFMIVGACTGLSVLFAHCYGTKDFKRLRRQHVNALICGIVFSVLLCILGLCGMRVILLLIHTPPALFEYTKIYLGWIFISLPATFLYNMYASALRAAGDTVAASVILAASVAANLLLDIFFVAFLHLGIRGAAQATALTQLISALLCVGYMFHSHKELIFNRQEFRPDKSVINSTVRCCFVTAVHQAGLYIGKVLIQGTVNTAGTSVISAYTAATRIEGFVNSFGDSASAATSVLISQNDGTGNTKRVEKTFRCCMLFHLLSGCVCALILYAAAPPAVRLLTANADTLTLTQAVRYLQLIAFFYPLCYTGGTFTGYYNGREAMKLTLAGTVMQITLRVLLSWALFPQLELCAVAAATGIGWFLTNVFWAFCKKKLLVRMIQTE